MGDVAEEDKSSKFEYCMSGDTAGRVARTWILLLRLALRDAALMERKTIYAGTSPVACQVPRNGWYRGAGANRRLPVSGSPKPPDALTIAFSPELLTRELAGGSANPGVGIRRQRTQPGKWLKAPGLAGTASDAWELPGKLWRQDARSRLSLTPRSASPRPPIAAR